MKKRLTLYERLKPEHRDRLNAYYTQFPSIHKEMTEVLSSEYFFTNIRYGMASDIEWTCELSYLGDAFND
jgi:hypothetical protein